MKRGCLITNALACFLWMFFVFFILASPVFAEPGGMRPVVRVGVLNHSTYADQDDQGIWHGLDVECMISIAQRAGFNVEFIDSSLDSDFLGGLDQHTYDVVADVVKTPEREANYLFTDVAIGYTNSTMAVRADDDRWDYGNIEQVSRMKVGLLSTYANNADFRKWCAEHGVTPGIIEYPDIAQMEKALLNGEIDAEVYTAVYHEEADKLRTIMRFLPESFYYAFRKDDLALKNQADHALFQILAGNVDYLQGLKSKYEEQYKVNALPFSSIERAYLTAHPVIRVAVFDHDAPYYEKKADGTDTGIIPDYYALVGKDTGISFRYVVFQRLEEAVAAIKSGEVDMLGLFSNGIIAAHQYGLALTDNYYTANRVLLAKSGRELSSLASIAVRNGTPDALLNNIHTGFPEAEVKMYANAQACFDAMAAGKSAAVLLGLPSATWQLNQTNTNAYSIIPMPGASFELCGAVSSDNLILCSILNKRIATTKGSFSGIMAKDTLPQSDWKTAISRVPPNVLLLTFCLLLALVLGLVWSIILLRIRERERNAVLAAQAETEKEKLQIAAIQKNAEERNTFFANISHDMRTPLNAVMNFIRLARKESQLPEQKDAFLAKAEASSKLMLDLIDDTLTVSKLSSGKLELRLEPCRAMELLATVALPVRELAEHKKIDFQVDFSQMQDDMILADQLNIEKIFLNLLTNAVRYTPQGGHIWYIVSQEEQEAGKACYVMTVRDDGIGIHEDFLPHLFEPFAQEKRKGYESVGTGLGLSIVDRLVRLMGGSIEVKSKPGEGTAFRVILSFARVQESQVPLRQDISYDHTKLSGKTVLLCEDNALNREIAIALLKDKNMSVVCAENGEIGVNIFSASAAAEFAAILMDVRMPVMDGLQATREIRSLQRPDAKQIPIIALTADAFADDIQKCREAGMNDHVAKPVNPEVMFSVLLRNLSS